MSATSARSSQPTLLGRKRIGLLVALPLLFLMTSAMAQQKVSLQLRWDHQFQFAGYYAAQWQGYYKEAGFEVEIRSAITPDRKIRSATEEVANGNADFGVGAADILLARDRGIPLVVLASIFQQSAAEFYIREDTPLQSLVDLLKLRVARTVNDLIDIELQAMVLSEGIDPKQITPYPHSSGLEHFVSGRVDVVPGYRITLPYVLEQLGIRVKTLRPSSYGVDFYGDSLFTLRQRVERDPDAIRRFVQATLKGWAYALENPLEIAERISRQLPRTEPIAGGTLHEFNLFQTDGVRKLALFPIVEIGHNNPYRWLRMHRLMQAIGILTNSIDIDDLIFDPEKMEQARKTRVHSIVRNLLYILAGTTLLILAWTFMLRQTVKQKTRQLVMANQRLDQENLLLRQVETSLKQSEERYRELNVELEERIHQRTAQLQALNTELEAFAYSVSHDLKAPLRGIDGYGHLLLKDCSDRLDAEGRLFVHNIRQGARQMHELIDGLLAYSRMERRTLRRDSLDLREAIEAVVAERAGEIGTGDATVRVDLPALAVRADMEGLLQILRNLLDNALKFGRRGVPLAIEIGGQTDAGTATLWVRDNGIGFDPKHRERIFALFQRLQRAEDYPGTGIGLAIARKAAQRMGGRLWAESAPGQGAVFFLELPT